jgi:hypothetical protein
VLARFALTRTPRRRRVPAKRPGPATNTNLTLTGQVLDNLSGVAGAQWRIDNGELQAGAGADGSFSITTAGHRWLGRWPVHTLTVSPPPTPPATGAAYTRSFILDTQAPALT